MHRPPACGYILLATQLIFLSSITVFAQHQWTQRNPLRQPYGLTSVAWSGTPVSDPGFIVITGDSGHIRTSADYGKTWIDRNSGTRHRINKVHYWYSRNRFIAVGDSGLYLTSPDGVTWETTTAATVRNLNSVAYSDSLALYVAVGDSGTIVTSPDGVGWTSQNTMTSLNLNGVWWAKNDYDKLFIAVGDSGIILSSQNGVEWRKDSSGVTVDLNCVTGDIYALGDSCTILLTNSSRRGWVKSHRLLSGFHCFSDLSDYANNIAVGDNSFYKYERPYEWTSVSPGRSDNYHDIVWMGNPIGYLVVGDSGYIVSKDGTNWVSGGGTVTRDHLRSVTWTGSLLVASGDSKTIIYSSDGIEWNIVKDNTYPVENVTWAGGTIVGAGQTFSSTRFYDNNYGNWYTELRSTPSLYFSTNAATWTSVNIGPTTIYCSECMEPDPMPDNIFIPSSVTWAGDKYVAVGSYGGTVTSPDGATWSGVVSAGSRSLLSVIWTGSRCVAVGDSGAICTSPDGVAWKEQESGIAGKLRAVVWSGNRLIAVGDSGAVCSSSDGILWSRQESGVRLTLMSAAWSGNQFVAVGSKCVTLSSQDGETWINRPGIFMENEALTSIVWTGKEFVTVGSGGLIFTSAEDPTSIAAACRQSAPSGPRIRARYSSTRLAVALDGFPSDAPIELRVYTLQGRYMYSSRSMVPVFFVPLHAAAGMYFVKAEAGGVRAAGVVVVQKR